MKEPLPVDQLRRIINPDSIKIDEAGATPIETIIGQERAVNALKTGLGITANGFNVFVAGQPGTGRLSAVDKFLEIYSREMAQPPDWVYVNNFVDPYRPCAIKFPPGKAREFKHDMEEMIKEVQDSLKKTFESEDYSKHREEILKDWKSIQNEIFSGLSKEARAQGFEIQTTVTGTFAVPLAADGSPMTDQQFDQLNGDQQSEIIKKQNEINDAIKTAIKQLRGKEKEINQKLEDLKHETALNAIGIILEELKEKYEKTELDGVLKYLVDVEADILNNLNYFIKSTTQGKEQVPFMIPEAVDLSGSPLKKYKVNVLVDNAGLNHAPVVIERNPTYNNLFGKIEKESKFGALVTDFTLIRDGALHRANGGFLVLPVRDLLNNPFVYDCLKRTLVADEVQIEEVSDRLGFILAKSIDPQPIPLDCKVILVGDPLVYHLLYQYDKDFHELFKIVADFDVQMGNTDLNIKNFINLIMKLCKEDNLMLLDNAGMAKVLEHAIRLAGDQEKISTKFGEISDLLKEADYHSRQNKHEKITEEDIIQTIEAKNYRSGLLKEKIQESIERNVLFIDIEGQKVGQVNGLAVLDLGDLMFGRPSRITVSTRLGREGVIDIEREAKLGGKIHSKGVMILNGYLAETFGQDFPISLSASIVFEQSYGEVDGDSASSTELFALLSSLANVPIKQGIAVTGSVNQKGEVQAVGGVNEKIEGYYEVCKVKGLTGEQGVMMPFANQKHLMLKEEVLEAVKNNQFKIWAVEDINEGIEILTGEPADSIKSKVQGRLKAMADKMRDFGKNKKKKDK